MKSRHLRVVAFAAAVVACGGESGGTTPEPLPTNPVPQIHGLTPNTVVAGTAATTVTIRGNNFVPSSTVSLGTAPRNVTFVSSGELRVALLESDTEDLAAHELRVVNPLPGGGVSNAFVFEVYVTAPTLATISHSQLNALLPQFFLTLTGTGFVKRSVMLVNGLPRPTFFRNPTEIVGTLTSMDLGDADTLQIRVTTSGQGGGTTDTRTILVFNPIPTITALPSTGAHAGRGGFALQVHGTKFTRSSQVRWNGVARPTQYVSDQLLIGEIQGADVAAPNSAQISVVNRAPGGGASNAIGMTIRSVPSASLTKADSILVSPSAIVSDPLRNLLYITTGPAASAAEQSVMVVDPFTKSITKRMPLENRPTGLALSHDGQFLYVSLPAVNAVRRIQLNSFTTDIQWRLSGENAVASAMLAIPGMPRSIVVAIGGVGPAERLQVFDDSIPRPVTSRSGYDIATLGRPDTLFTVDPFGLSTVEITATGVKEVKRNEGLEILRVGASLRLYGLNGAVFDATRYVRVGTFSIPASQNAILVSPELGRLFALVNVDNIELKAYDLNTFQHLGTITLNPSYPPVHDFYNTLVRWTTDGLAFLQGNKVHLLRSPLFAP